MNLSYTHLTIFFSLLLLISCRSNGLLTSCITAYNEQTDDPYRANVLSLFTTFTTSSSSFYNTSVGDSPDKAYGLYLCRGDTTTDTCRTCISSLTSSWATTLKDCKEGVAFMDHCMAHYANYSFFGKADDSIRGFQMGKGFTNASQYYNTTLEGILQDVIVSPFTGKTSSFAASVGSYIDRDQKAKPMYALAQCTPDIDSGDCRGCLTAAKTYLLANITRVANSAWALLPSCQLRYDNVRFFGDLPSASTPSLLSVSAFLLPIVSLLFLAF